MSKRLAALALALMLLFSLTGCEDTWEDIPTETAAQETDTPSLADMPYEVYDPENFYAALDRLDALGQTPGKEAELTSCYYSLIAELNQLQTDYALAQLRYSEDLSSGTYASDLAAMEETYSEVYDALYQSLETLLTGDYAAFTEALLDNEALVSEILDYQELDEDLEDLSQQATKVVQFYNELSLEDVSVTVEGEEYTFETAEYIEDDDTYWAVYTALTKAENTLLAPQLVELISLHNREAALYGYDSYAGLAYENYGRDFTPEDAKALHAAVKECIVPLYQEVEELDYSYEMGDDFSYLTAEELLDIVSGHIGSVDPNLKLSFDHMVRYGLYSIDYFSGRGDGYTINLPQYNDAAIFIDRLGGASDVETLVHEFGHYNADIHQNMATLSSGFPLDTSEIHSQGLEVLFLNCADDLYGEEDSTAQKLNVVYTLLDSIVQGCLQDEFQQEAYAAAQDHDLTVEELNRLAYRLYSEYGLATDPEAQELYSWVNIPHTFESPFYYISYATSAINALDLLSVSQEDYQKAVDTYMSLTALDSSVSYQDALAQVGLHSTFEADTLRFIGEGVERYVESVVDLADLAA